MHELRSGPCPPQTLRGSVVEHRRAESEDLRSDSHGDMYISLAGSKSNHLSYSICYPVGIFQISQKVYV